ncbi:MAG: uroporphyrinogen-III synthase [Elusimicrobia bacterium]|nr:uroporphyrinogen-III synthase [Elusimicrobiota bacterium]
MKIRNKTLFGKNIVVTRAKHQASDFAKILKSHGANVLLCPTIKILSPLDFKPLDKAIKTLSIYDWLIFTSVNGVEKFMERASKIYKNFICPTSLKTCAIGPLTKQKMIFFGFPVTLVSKEYVAESILEALPEVKNKRILIPRAQSARDLLPKELKKKGATVDVVETYRTIIDGSNFSELLNWLGKNMIDCITFTSSSTVKNFFSLLTRRQKNKILGNKNIFSASIGPITTETLKEVGWDPKIIAKKPTTKHLAGAIIKFYKNEH